jgi:uncharacterized repeat protein (TIGR03803 family)
MQTHKFSSGLAALFVMLTTFSSSTLAQEEFQLHDFGARGDGLSPAGSLVFDPAGDLYGATIGGGTYGHGTVFQLSSTSFGSWAETLLYSFSGTDGSVPAAGVVVDSSGNLYGTTQQGGAYNYGTVFELLPASGGVWSIKILHSFDQSAKTRDGWGPLAGLVRDSSGNLYGTTEFGGDHGAGTVFEVSPQSDGTWSEQVIHSCGVSRKDGTNSFASLILDSAGNLYGTTEYGGNKLFGTVFKLSPSSTGWTEQILYNFSYLSTSGYNPNGSLIFDASGNLYSTTYYGGARNVGTVFELTPTASGEWKETVLHSFDNNQIDGTYPVANLVFSMPPATSTAPHRKAALLTTQA